MKTQERTFQLTKEEAIRDRKWIVVDAAGLPLGRLASQVAHLLRGKHKPTFTPHVDCGDYVVVINASQIVMKGQRLQNKVYHKHTGYIGGIKATSAAEMLEKNPERMITLAVKRMVKRGALGHQIIKKLKVYRGSEHPHLAQNPEVIKFH
ncbi:MAG: 50S ribosomal protein L13 [Bdellovibrionales bacterium]|nr:50S ribosomal protein L13 [Bdellovibrionales bacterium]